MSFYCSADEYINRWYGPFETKEDAILEGIKRYSDYFYIGRAKSPELHLEDHVESMLYSISEDFYTDSPIVGYDGDDFPWEDWPPEKNIDELVLTIEKVVGHWVKENCPITWQELVDIECISCDKHLL